MITTKTVLITGSSKGLGRALVDAFVESHCVVFAVVRSREVAESLEATYPGAVHALVADVTSADLGNGIAKVLESNGSTLDILVNNAGTRGYLLSIEDELEDEVASLLNVHCLGALRATRAVLPFLRKSTAPLIVNITSRLGSIKRTSRGDFADERLSYSYRIAKAAQNMMTLCLDQELRPEGITVCAVHPGALKTESGPPDATTSPEEGGRRLVEWILSAGPSVAGTYQELDSGHDQW